MNNKTSVRAGKKGLVPLRIKHDTEEKGATKRKAVGGKRQGKKPLPTVRLCGRPGIQRETCIQREPITIKKRRKKVPLMKRFPLYCDSFEKNKRGVLVRILIITGGPAEVGRLAEDVLCPIGGGD